MSKSFKSVTLITSPGKGMPLVEELFKRGHFMVDLSHARGSMVGGPVHRNGTPVEGEQEIVTCVVRAEQADETFALIHELAGVSQAGGGFLYMQKLGRSTEMVIG